MNCLSGALCPLSHPLTGDQISWACANKNSRSHSILGLIAGTQSAISLGLEGYILKNIDNYISLLIFPRFFFWSVKIACIHFNHLKNTE